MGDNILMKTQLLTAIFLSSVLYAADANMSWVDQKIEEIKPQRKGISGRYISSLKNPFIRIKSESKDGSKKGALSKTSTTTGKEKKEVPEKRDMSQGPLTLQMVLNSSALISGKWYKENAKVKGYTLVEIQNNSVVLQGKKKKLKLFIAQKSKNLNISTK